MNPFKNSLRSKSQICTLNCHILCIFYDANLPQISKWKKDCNVQCSFHDWESMLKNLRKCTWLGKPQLNFPPGGI